MTRYPSLRFAPAVYVAVAVLGIGSLRADYVERTGFVSLQFDDSHDLHYTRVFPALQEHGLKAGFGYITESSDLGIDHEAWKMQEIYQAGHEIQDHTTKHDYMWATHVDTLADGIDDWIPFIFGDEVVWDSLCSRSLQILDSLGIGVTGWNQPGGASWPGCIPDHPEWKWTGVVNDSMYRLIGSRFAYAIGYGASASTAHLNLRGHNYPGRFPFFNVPHVTIDYRDLEEVKTGIADAVASGLWYLAVSHAQYLSQVDVVDSLIDWLDAKDIEVLTCRQGVERVQFGHADPLENQIPQARMLFDLDGNNKPDGFTGDCVWDTVSTPPIPEVRCLRAAGDISFYCYGPELGTNDFSVWMRSATGSPAIVKLVCVKIGFEGEYLSDNWTYVQVPVAWTKIDALGYAALSIHVTDEVDRLRFDFRVNPYNRSMIVYPELMLVPEAGIAPGGEISHDSVRLMAFPNPVRIGSPLGIRLTEPVDELYVYDVLGRCLLATRPPSGLNGISIRTDGLSPGIVFVGDSSKRGRQAKVVVLR